MKHLKHLAFMLYLLNSSVFANLIETPSPLEILHAQIKCNPAIFKKYNWINPSALNQLAKNRIILANNVSIKTIPFMPNGEKYDDGEDWGQKKSEFDQRYRLSFRIIGAGLYGISCDKDEAFIKKIYDKENISKHKIKDSFEDNDFFIRKTKENKFSIERDGTGESNYATYPDFIQKNNQGDIINSGLVCIVNIEDFIKNKNIINIDTLCENQPQSKKDLMKWAIDNLHEFYKSKYAEWKKTAKPDRK
ncbi:MAG: hypothetical protein HQK50_13565 [Oligoflexia bacterium]|nr:hypothetical protein [Oligoflexia bacterium]